MEDVNLPTTNTELGDKLQREMASVTALKESLGRSDTLTHNMLSILNSFESRLGKLEETIMPIYQETGNLQRRHENIEKTLGALDHVIGFYHVAEEVEPVIRDGPSHGLENYVSCMNKLQTAVDYFTVNSPGSPEMSQVTTLFEAGKDALEREFRQLLQRHGRPVPPVVILDILAQEEEEVTAEDAVTIEQLPAKVHQELVSLTSWLHSCGDNSDYMDVYSSLRSSQLVKTLQCLRDHLKTGSKDSSTLSSMAHSPALKLKSTKDTPSKAKALKRMDFVRKASNTLKKQMAHLEAAGLVKQGSATTELHDAVMDVDIDFYITAVSALLKLIQSEAQLLQSLVPEKHQRKVFDALIQGGLEVVVKEGEQISGYIKRATNRQHHSAVISIFPVLKHLRGIKPEFDFTLEGCRTATRTRLASLISTLDATGAKALEEFVDSIRNDPDKASNMPPDGTVHELTNNSMVLLEQLLEFADTAGSMLLTQDPTSLPNVKNVDRPRLKLAEYVTKVLSALGLNLSNKSETYSDVTLRAIFLLNNYNYMLKSLRRSGLLELVHSWNSEVEMFYEDQVQNQKRVYSQSWSRVLHYIMEKEKDQQRAPPEGKLKEKERQLIKDRFTGFNKEIEEISRVQQGYAIPDQELRQALQQDNREYVLPFYRDFLTKYTQTNFTKNPEKYIKHSEKDVAAFIARFFDSTA